MAKRKQGYQVHSEIDDVALKQFYKCESCVRYLRGYKAYKNQQYYYKCNMKGCSCNRKADERHRKFLNIVSKYSFGVDEETKSLVREQIIAEYNRQKDRKDTHLR